MGAWFHHIAGVRGGQAPSACLPLRSLALLALCCLLAASARPVQAATHSLQFQLLDCRAQACPDAGPGRWTWFSVNAAALADLAPGWQLLVDNVRFSRVTVRIGHTGGQWAVARDEHGLRRNWTLGNNLRFAVPMAGRTVNTMRIGFRDLDSPALMRTIKAMDRADHAEFVAGWTRLVALVMGVLLSALVYNMFLLTWLHIGFQRWYVIWAAAAGAYTMVWSGQIAALVPVLAGPAAMRISYVLVGVLIVAGTNFFFAFIEQGKLPQRLIRFGQVTGVGAAALGLVASLDTLAPAVTDRLFNLALAIVTLAIAVGSAIALRRGSRAIWFYLIGWLPPLSLLVVRILRNFGHLPQDDLIDQAGFAALGWEALLLSLAIADRFRQLRAEADAADNERRTLLKLATTDPLTGLGNRALFQGLLDRPIKPGHGVDVIAVDIDLLKQTNDMAGHDAGDALIIAVADRLSAAAGPQATLARIGGDEFVIVLEGDARNRLAAIRQMIALSSGVPMRHGGHDLMMSMCAGHASNEGSDGDALDMQALFKLADLALYSAKASGRGRWCRYDQGMASAADARSRLLAEARSAVQTGQFCLHYQPIVGSNGRVFAQAALLRWQHPQLGVLAPAQFADVMGDPALALAVQQRLLRAAIQHAAQLTRADPTAAVAVACSTAQLDGPAAAIALLDELARHALPPAALILEVSEALAAPGTAAAVLECLECLRDAGVRVALDEFGAGSASLLHLRDLPATLIKLDAALVESLNASGGAVHVVQAIIDLAHRLGKQVIAQGVDNEAQRRILNSLGCDFTQGLVHGRAQPATELAA